MESLSLTMKALCRWPGLPLGHVRRSVICVLLIFVCPLVSFASGDGSSPAGDLIVPVRKFITRTVHIPGGSYATPYVCSLNNTEYILDGDMAAAGSAILVRASRVVVNLNGKTVIYNQSSPGEGVYIDAYNQKDIAIVNGSILQGAALSEGDLYGAGNNPIRSKGTDRLHVARINARYGGRDVGGIFVSTANSIIEENLLEDVWTSGTFKNRHQGVSAISAKSGSNIIRNNVIRNCRQRGISVTNNDQIYGNTISINSLATNSYGILGYKAQHVKVYNNTITGIGEHPIGIGFVSAGTTDIEIYNNRIDVQTTKLGDEYGGSAACLNPETPCGNYAVGFRTTWGGNNINFHDNTIVVRTDSRYSGTYSPTGKPVIINGKGRGLMVAINAGETSQFKSNSITVLDKDGTGKAFGIACTGGNSGDMTFEENRVASNILNVALSDEYGACNNHPLFIGNTFVKVDNYPVYRTVAAEFNGYNEATGRFVSNKYQNGASIKNINLYNDTTSKKLKSVYFGREAVAMLQESPALTPLAEAILTIDNGGIPFDSTAITASDGTAKVIVYDYELHNRNGAGATRYLAPHRISLRVGAVAYSTQTDNSTMAWDALTGTGPFTLGLYLNGNLDAAKKLMLTY